MLGHSLIQKEWIDMAQEKETKKLDQPSRRPLKIYASDPMLQGPSGNRITVEVQNEKLAPGPRGERLEVVDYDISHDRYYRPVNLDDPAILMSGGLDPRESDPRFHQQMVYAVAMRTIENFDRALGRKMELRRKKRTQRLRLLPHAFHGANAYYDSDQHAVLFGYFRADRENPGKNMPGQNVFTCLSHDIIAHEVTHAVCHRLRRYFLEPSNEDVLAFHEGFSDIVALLQHFSFQEMLKDQIQKTRTDLRKKTLLVELAQQFGYATGAGAALRSAIDDPEKRLYQNTFEPHLRGSILVAAVFDGYFNVYQRRIHDLIRIATGGTGNLPDGDLHPDLVNRIALEAAKSAQYFLTMCIRAFDYLPPVDVTFGDYLRALVTADVELVATDEFGQRNLVIEAFRQRGIYPENVISLAEESLQWEPADPKIPPVPFLRMNEFLQYMLFNVEWFSRPALRREDAIESVEAAVGQRLTSQSSEGAELEFTRSIARGLHAYAKANATKLRLDPALPIEVSGFHLSFRVAPSGRLVVELVSQFAQKDKTRKEELGGIPFRGGTTLITDAQGQPRYVISKPLHSARLTGTIKREAKERLHRQRAFLDRLDQLDPAVPYMDEEHYRRRMQLRMNLRSLHQGVL
jgi:hypothetical protein